MSQFQLLTAVLATCFSLCGAEHFFVTPTVPAPSNCLQPCYTLDQYAQNALLFEGQTNISLVFLNGIHNLTNDLIVDGSAVHELVIRGLHSSTSLDDLGAVIDIQEGVRILVSHVACFELLSIRVRGQVQFADIPIPSIYGTETQFQPLVLFSVSNITQSKVYLENIDLSVVTDGTQALSVTVTECNYKDSRLDISCNSTLYGEINIRRTTFSASSTIAYFQRVYSYFQLAGLKFYCPSQTQLQSNTSTLLVDIDDSNFTRWFSGIKFCCNQFEDSQVMITNSLFTQNVYGIRVLSRLSEFAVKKSQFIGTADVSNLISFNTQLSFSIGVYIFNGLIDHLLVENTTFTNISSCGLYIFASTVLSIEVKSSNFVQIRFIGIYIQFSQVKSLNFQNNKISQNLYGFVSFPSLPINSTISNTVVTENEFGIVFLSKISASNHSLVLINCLVTSNSNAAFTMYNFGGSTLVKDCSFHNNRGTPIIAFQSTIELSGDTDFVNNTAIRGGAISLIDSEVTLADNSNITFMDNSANEYGGALYVASLRYLGLEVFKDIIITAERERINVLATIPCFYQFDAAATKQTNLNINVTFVNNAAELGGKNIYGVPLSAHCTLSNGHRLQPEDIFKFADETEISSIASDPTRVCFCVNTTATSCDRTKIVHNEVRYPGEEFTIPVVLVGFEFGTVTGTVHARIVTNSARPLERNLRIQRVDYNSCNKLKYAVHLQPGEEIIKLTSQVNGDTDFHSSEIDSNQKNVDSDFCQSNDQCTARLTTPIYVNLTLETCPLGFRLNEMLFTCECDETLSKLSQHVTCEIRDHTGLITRNGALWVGVDIKTHGKTTNTTTSEYLWHKHCLQDYCKNKSDPFELVDPDKQCKMNRSGILCGSCVPGFSLQLGSNTCTDCEDNNGLSLLLFFVAAGILLVFLIKFLDLTVASGTINGLVFYSNVVWGYNSILLPTPSKDPLYLILTLPIAWINLDFGIETCFFNGLDSFWKAWLQFLFPLYIWLIAGLIILVSRYSTRATKLFGNNSVAVLATLFLLSYGKLFRNTIIILTPAEMHYSNSNTTLTVWAYDGNLQYGNSIHGVLLAAALGVLTFLWLPYTLILLLVPILKAKSHLRPLHWINTLKPFFDTYYGPHNDKILYQCWTGMLLVVRGVLLVIFAATSTVRPNANILLLGVIATILLTVSAMSVYKKWYLSLAENLYLLNLIILSCGFLFDPDTKSESDYPVITAVSIAFALFQSAIFIGNHLIQKCLSVTSCARKDLDRPANKEVVQLPNKLVEQENQPFDSNRRYRDSILEYVTDSV